RPPVSPSSVPAAQVSAWLERTLRAVPPGSEAGQLGIDAGLAELLAPSPRLSATLEQGAAADDLWLRDPWPSDETADGE
ncbi:hypothetical protein AB0885_19135, partial [Streptomyces sp. NPDC005534]